MRVFSPLALLLVISAFAGCNNEVVPSAGAEAVAPPPGQIAVTPPVQIAITSASQLPDGSVGSAYSTTLNAAGGSAPYRWQITSGALPAGLSLDETTGVIAGTPATALTASLLIVARDANAASASANLSLRVLPAPLITPPLVITTSPQLPGGSVGSAYSTTLTSTGGTSPYLWQVTSGALPAGISLDQSTGVIAGTPTSPVTASLTIAVRDANAVITSLGLSLQILPASVITPPLVIATASQLPGGTVGAAYSTTLTATGGTPPYRWQVTSGAPPAGISLNQTNGVLAGTPTTAVSASLSVTLTDANAVSTSTGFQLRISPPALVITSATQLPAAAVGAAYSTALNATGGIPPYRWQVTAGALPGGLSLNQTTGVISGTPTTSLTATPSISVSDASAASASVTISLRVAPAALSITTATQLPGGVVSTPYSTTLAVTGGTSPYRWVLVAGSLPAGLSLNQTTGVISGTPTTAIAATFSVAVTDAASVNAYANLALTVTGASGPSLAISSSAQLPAGTVSVPYSTTLAASGGTAPYSWQIISGALPAGLSLNQTSGVISGTPTGAGTASVSITVTDANTGSASRAFSLQVVSAASLTITTASALPDGATNSAYSTTLNASGGTAPYRWTVVSGTLQTGLALNQTTGVISGTPASTGTASLLISVTDANSASVSAGFTLRTSAAPLSVTTSPQLPTGTVNGAYSATLSATGGTTPYSWQVTAGTLPAGLSLNQTTGVISGTPTASVTASFSISVTDANATTAAATFGLAINPESTGWTLVWSDEFDGTTIDGSKWLNPTNDNSCGALVKSTFMGDDAYLDGNGHLVLRAQSRASGGCGANHVTAGQVSTKGRFAQAYGKFEFRAQMPAGGGSGSWPALWLYPIGNTWPPEIDVLEMQADPNVAYLTYHWGTEANHQQSFESLTIPGLSSGYHTFAVEWDPGAITWFIDGIPVRSSFLGSNVTSIPMGIIMGMQIGDWNGAAISPTFPKYLNVDYVRVYKRQ